MISIQLKGEREWLATTSTSDLVDYLLAELNEYGFTPTAKRAAEELAERDSLRGDL